MLSQSRVQQSRVSAMEMKANPVIIGVAADSGCGKSTFMRRLTSIFGGESKMLDIGRETNTLISDMTTVICLDDYHKWDRTGRASNPEYPDGITALDEKCQDWDKMAADVTDLKAGKTVSKPIYNHITGELDPYEEVPATPIVIFEGLHPLYDSRVNAALDLSIYLDITDEVKFAWKEKADIVIQVLMSDVVPDGSGKFLKVKFIQRKDCALLESAYLMDEGSAVSWTPNSEKLASEAGVKLASYSEDWYGNEVSVVEMDGAVDKLEEIIYLESQLCNTGTKFYGELTEQIVKNKDAPGSDNGTGLMQTLCSFKIREVYEKLTK